MASSPAAAPCPSRFGTAAASEPGMLGSHRRGAARDAVKARPVPC
ncbi:hypothetical protein CKAH01_02370 [Colletotrichum kahawae]|uniref:Uncharacterized protein n=1 Tax=Colletotrichum kahawae TaxID=34407 RepID=A0AAD9Y099_COLKA|nr:hypothetical protein CKAH01_02370 [Colletotrichum kahawae]